MAVTHLTTEQRAMCEKHEALWGASSADSARLSRPAETITLANDCLGSGGTVELNGETVDLRLVSAVDGEWVYSIHPHSVFSAFEGVYEWALDDDEADSDAGPMVTGVGCGAVGVQTAAALDIRDLIGTIAQDMKDGHAKAAEAARKAEAEQVVARAVERTIAFR